MESPERNEPELSQNRRRASWIISALGLIVLLSGVLYLTSSTVGGRVNRFEERRTYNQVKRNMYVALPVAFSLGFGGLGLMFLGARLRRL